MGDGSPTALVSVPDVRGLSFPEARRVIRRAGLRLAGPPSAPGSGWDWSTSPADMIADWVANWATGWLEGRARIIVAQNPPPGTTAKRGSTVTVYVGSRGQGPVAHA
jgi:beta-lactam-binding protein with PASTA domain